MEVDWQWIVQQNYQLGIILSISFSDLTTIILYSIQLSNSSSNISESFAKIVSATGAFEGVLDMLKWESLVKEAPDAIDHITPTGEI